MIYYKFAIKLSIFFFGAATLLLFLFYLEPSLQRAMLAYQFTIVAIVVNWLFALFLLFMFLRRGLTLPQLGKSLGVMALNIPVGILYARAMVWLLSFARITFYNTGTESISEIRLHGCADQRLPDLAPGMKTTAWIKITTGCDIMIDFTENEQLKKQIVVKGLTEGKGFKMSYEVK